MKEFESIPAETERIAKIAIDCAFKVHSTLGLGLLESVYETCLTHELNKRAISFKRQVSLPVIYDDVRLDVGLRPDLDLEECVIVEVRSVEKTILLFEAQLLMGLKE